MNRTVTVIFGIVAVSITATLPLWANQGLLFIAGLTLIQALFALSWNLLFGYSGLASFGHAGFFAIGAYFVGAALRYKLGVPFPFLLMLAAFAGAGVAWIVGIFALRRLAGIFLALLTVALSEILRIVIGYADFLGREDGLNNIPRPTINLGFTSLNLSSGQAFYWFILFVGIVLTTALWWLTHSRFGRAFLVIRQDAERATFIGLNVYRYRLASFMISGAVAAAAGGLFAPWTRIVTLDEVNWLQSTQPMLNTLLGGSGSFWGPIIGAVVFAFISYSTRTYVGLSEIVVGGVLLVIILIAPGGIVGVYGSVRQSLGLRFRQGRIADSAGRPEDE